MSGPVNHEWNGIPIEPRGVFGRPPTPPMKILDDGVDRTIQARFRPGTARNLSSIMSLLAGFATRHNIRMEDQQTVLRFLEKQKLHSRAPNSLGGVLRYAETIRARFRERGLLTNRLDQYIVGLKQMGANAAKHQATPALTHHVRLIQSTYPIHVFAMFLLATGDADRFEGLYRLTTENLFFDNKYPNEMVIRWLHLSKMGPQAPYALNNVSHVVFPPSLTYVYRWLRSKTPVEPLFQTSPAQAYALLKRDPLLNHLSLRSFRRLAADLGVAAVNFSQQEIPIYALPIWLGHSSKLLPQSTCRYPSKLFELVKLGGAGKVGSAVMAKMFPGTTPSPV